MEGSRNFKDRDEKRIIIDDLASYEEEIGVGRSLKRGRGFGEFIKNVFVFLILIGIVVGSFWVSFLIGKRVLVPVKQLETREEPAILEERAPIEEEDLSALATFEQIKTTSERPAEVPAKKVEPKPEVQPEKIRYYKVHAGLFTTRLEADNLVRDLSARSVSSFIRKISDSAWRVQVGAYRTKSQAQAQVTELKNKGISSTIIYE